MRNAAIVNNAFYCSMTISEEHFLQEYTKTLPKSPFSKTCAESQDDHLRLKFFPFQASFHFFFITLFSNGEHDNAIQHLLWHKRKNAEGDASIRLNKARLEGMEDVELPLTFF